ncbi:MAG: hypothetical protein WBS18_06935 [Candidatus Acidiferrales bacterium]
MAKGKLKQAAVSIGTAVGRADRTAHETVNKVSKAGKIAKSELEELAKQIDAIKKQLKKTSKKLKKALK